MNTLIHLIYCSTALHDFSGRELEELLVKAQAKNAGKSITGMLLYVDGGFFQILEGGRQVVDELFAQIKQDPRHAKVVTIIHEPIPKRVFEDWTMGCASITSGDVEQIVGMNDFFVHGSCFQQLDQGRAKKLLSAFKEGRWRAKIKNSFISSHPPTLSPMLSANMPEANVSFAFQPIIDAQASAVYSYEAMARGLNNESLGVMLNLMDSEAVSRFDAHSRIIAIGLAARLGLNCHLHLKFMAMHADDANASIGSIIETAKRNNIEPSRIILEIDQDKFIIDTLAISKVIEKYRAAGLKIAIDHFGAGRAGLNLLEPYRPEIISLSVNLVRGIDTNGPRQAIVGGVAQTCLDLGIDILAKNVTTVDEYRCLRNARVNLFQGDLFGKSGFEQLPGAYFPEA